MDKEPNSGDMVDEFFGEWRGFANEPCHALSQDAVKTFAVLVALAVAVMLISENYALISP